MTRVSAIGFAALIAAVLFSVLWFNDNSAEQSATMAPDLNLANRP